MSITTIHNRAELHRFCFFHDVVLLACFETEDGPCQPLYEEFQRLAQLYNVPDRVGFAKLDVKEVPECVKEFEIYDLGTIVTFYRQEKDQTCGGLNPDDWQYVIEEAMKKVRN